MQKIFLPGLLTLSLLASVRVVQAADANFTVNTPVTATQYFLGGGETGTVNGISPNTGSITYTSSSNDITVDNTGNSSSTVFIYNSGTISNTNTGSGQNGRDIQVTGTGAAAVTLNVTNYAGGTLKTSYADVIQSGQTDTTATVNNYGTINAQNTGTSASGGQQAIDFNKVTAATTTVNNYTGGIIEAYDADAVRPGVGGFVNNDGMIKSTNPANSGDGSDGIDAQTNTGITIMNGGAIAGDTAGSALIEGARHGITGGNITGTGAYTMSITNGASGTIQGDNGSGVNIDGINGNEMVTINNSGLISGNGSYLPTGSTTQDGDGVDVDGVVTLTNSGTIKSLNALSDTSEGVTVGGGTITNTSTGKILGLMASGNTTSATGVGITLAGVDNPLPIQGIYAVSTVYNSGLIQGQTDSGIRATSLSNQFNITIYNYAGGTIEGGSTNTTAHAAIQIDGVAGSIASTVSNTVVNYGDISGASNGQAIELGAGKNEVDIMGGQATVEGGISGGVGSTNSLFTVQAGSNGAFTYSGNLTNFANVDIQNGTFNFGGVVTAMTTGTTTTIENGATLSGKGSVAALVIKAGGTLSPGNSPGTVSATSAVFNPTGNFLLQVDTDGSAGAAGSDWDQLAASATVDVSALGAGNQFVFELQSLASSTSDTTGALATSFDATTNHVWKDVVTSAGFIGTVNASDFLVNSSQFDEAFSGSFSIQQDGTSLDLVYTAPEPSTWALLFAGSGLLFALGRRRRRLG